MIGMRYPMKQGLIRFLAASLTAGALLPVAWAQPDRGRVGPAVTDNSIPSPAASKQQAAAESRLLEIYKLIAAGQSRQALPLAQKLVEDIPTFHLAQLVYADLLSARLGKIGAMGAVPTELASQAPNKLEQLRTEAQRRQQASLQKPPAGLVPAQFIQLPASTRHAIAVDASRSRLYLFENGPKGLQLVADHYASVGRLGIEKSVEGDQRTPLGVYYITSRLEGRQLTDFYGSGALLLNYPNEYDRRQGRTGSGIWLHGVPSDSYARSPNSTDGCVALYEGHVLVATHPRGQRKGQRVTTPDHLPPQAQWFFARDRQWLDEQASEAYLNAYIQTVKTLIQSPDDWLTQSATPSGHPGH